MYIYIFNKMFNVIINDILIYIKGVLERVRFIKLVIVGPLNS